MVEAAPRTNMITKNSFPATARHITIKPDWSKIIYSKPAGLAYVPTSTDFGQLVLQVEGYDQPGVLDGVPEKDMENLAPQLFHLFADTMLEIIAKDLAEDFKHVAIGLLRSYVRGNEAVYPGLIDNQSWGEYVNTESLLRIADKL